MRRRCWNLLVAVLVWERHAEHAIWNSNTYTPVGLKMFLHSIVLSSVDIIYQHLSFTRFKTGTPWRLLIFTYLHFYTGNFSSTWVKFLWCNGRFTRVQFSLHPCQHSSVFSFLPFFSIFSFYTSSEFYQATAKVSISRGKNTVYLSQWLVLTCDRS